jgi:hypothetical protein|tara:strand:+ start:1060 stop:1431 length:372 start_codon:yes stop_codon:yes gene_type:complete
MIPLQKEKLEDLIPKVYDLLNETKISIGYNTDGKTLASLSKIFSNDLIREKRWGLITFNQVQDAFRVAVRFGKDDPFLTIRNFYKWIWDHKKNRLDVATYNVETLKQNPKEVLYYQEPIKLLK